MRSDIVSAIQSIRCGSPLILSYPGQWPIAVFAPNSTSYSERALTGDIGGGKLESLVI